MIEQKRLWKDKSISPKHFWLDRYGCIHYQKSIFTGHILQYSIQPFAKENLFNSLSSKRNSLLLHTLKPTDEIICTTQKATNFFWLFWTNTISRMDAIKKTLMIKYKRSKLNIFHSLVFLISSYWPLLLKQDRLQHSISHISCCLVHVHVQFWRQWNSEENHQYKTSAIKFSKEKSSKFVEHS